MRLTLDPRVRRLLRRLPRTTVYSAMELLLLSLLAVQCARLLWAAVTPLEPVGDWKAIAAVRPAAQASPALLGSFDPFFRLSETASAPAVVTSLNLQLFGVREDRASGRGSAIIGLPEGQQRNFAVGEEISPGVTLIGVGFDYVTISRGGTQEQIFLDQSRSAGAGASSAPPPLAPPPISVLPTPAQPLPPPTPVVQVPPQPTNSSPGNVGATNDPEPQ
jgi:general secretion pathway protein C